MKVPLQIAFRNFRSSDAVMDALEKKVAWLEHFSEHIISCRIIIEKPNKNHLKGNLYHIRIDLRLPGQEIVVSREPSAHLQHKNLYIAIHDAFNEARRELEDFTQKRWRDLKQTQSSNQAYVVRLVHEDGHYGFIRTLDGRDIYFHSHSVLNNQYDQLEEGTWVRFVEEKGDQGPQASTIELIKKQGSHSKAA